jgi:hypothetical protein
LPETKNRSIESILLELNGDPPVERGCGTWASKSYTFKHIAF